MLEYNKYYELLLKYRMITPICKHELHLIKDELKASNSDIDGYLNLFSIYFSLVDSGNVCMTLNETKLKEKWENQIKGAKTLATDNTRYSDDVIEEANA
ncbi:MAG: hypothetical protein IKN46_03965, partial [Acholeplasmatales bacterium]|nr:hypothetical protein [Acholeplasmatales bacterium]